MAVATAVPAMRRHARQHVVEVMKAHGVEPSQVHSARGGAEQRLPNGRVAYVRTRTDVNPSGQWWFTVGPPASDHISSHFIFVFGPDNCRCAVTTIGELMWYEAGLYSSGTKFKPTFRFDDAGGLWLQVHDNYEPVSHWLGAFEQLVI